MNSENFAQQTILQNHYALNTLQIDLIKQYITLLQKWNKTYNLTAIDDTQSIYTHHIFDSLSAWLVLEKHLQNNLIKIDNSKPLNLIDVGSGAGLPGMLWSIAQLKAQNKLMNLNIYSVDKVQKKISFQQFASKQLGLTQFFAHHTRIEDFKTILPNVDIITARAYSSIETIIQQTKHLQSNHPLGCYVLLRGQIDEELRFWQAKSLKGQCSLQLINVPDLDALRHVLIIPFNTCGT